MNPISTIIAVVGLLLFSSCEQEANKTYVKRIHRIAPSSDDAVTNNDSGQSQLVQNPEVVASFEANLYPLLRDNCKQCHEGQAAPYLSAANSQDALAALLTGKKIDFNDAGQSRIVLRLAAENHNCWSDCQANGESILTAMQKWQEEIVSHLNSSNTNPTISSGNLGLVNVRPVAPIENVQIFKLDLHSRTPHYSIVNDDTAMDGSHLVTNNGGLLIFEDEIAQNDAGEIVVPFFINETGNYFLFGHVKSSGREGESFFTKLDDNNYETWDIASNEAGWHWNIFKRRTDPRNFQTRRNRTFNLTAGSHQLVIRQRSDQLPIDSVTLTRSANVDDLTFTGHSHTRLAFSFGTYVEGVEVTLGISQYNDQSYLISHLGVTSQSHKVKIAGIKVLLNNQQKAENATFSQISTIISPGHTLVSKSPLILLVDQGKDIDQLSITLDQLEVVDDQ